MAKKDREELSKILHKICKNVYYSPPSDMNMVYPCIVYKLANLSSIHADNIKYHNMTQYTVTVIDEHPDSKIRDKIYNLQYCSFDRGFTRDGLNHFVFRLYY